MTKESKKTVKIGDKELDLSAKGIVNLLRKPGVVVTILTVAGLATDDTVAAVNKLLTLDLPAWSLLGLVALYILARAGYYGLMKLSKMSETIEKILARLEQGDDNFKEIRGIAGGNKERLDVIEGFIGDKWKAELAAYKEKTRRETGKIGLQTPGSDDS